MTVKITTFTQTLTHLSGMGTFVSNPFRKKPTLKLFTFLLGTTCVFSLNQDLNNNPPLPSVCAHSVPSISRISLFLLCMTGQLELLSILKPHYITGSVLGHSVSHPVFLSLSFFLPPFSLSSVQRMLSPACMVLGVCLPAR